MTFKLLAKCFCAALASAVVYGSEPLTLTTPEQENKLGEQAYKEILQKEKVSQDKELVAFVERVAKRIIAVAPDKGFKYEISVLESPNVNAFCLPGGKICVYTGILPYCQNEAGLGTVVGHEVAHAILRHGGQRMTQGTVVNIIGEGLSKVLEYEQVSATTKTVAEGAYGYGTQLGILLPYSRSHETEADLSGLWYLAAAGYDPREAAEFWKRFGALKSNLPSFLSTHPAHEDREQRLEQSMRRAQKLYAKSAKLGLGERLPAAYLTTKVASDGKQNSTASATAPQESPSVARGEGQSKKRNKAASDTPAAGTTIESLAQDEIKKGLQTALNVGFKKALKLLGKEDGYFKDLAVKIVMPEKLRDIEKIVRTLGKDKLADDFIQQMNRAAEKAAPATAEILAEAISGLTLNDARDILQGPADAATQYFRRSCDDSLQRNISPIVKSATEEVGATKAYKNLVKKGGLGARLLLGDFDLDAYVTRKAVDGLYLKMAEEEKAIRANPAGQANEILRRIFGALGK